MERHRRRSYTDGILVKNRQQLMDAAQAVLDDNTITSHVKRIRRKFLAIDSDFNSIETVYGMGYRWIAD